MNSNNFLNFLFTVALCFFACSMFSCKENENEGYFTGLEYVPIEIEVEGISLNTPNETDYVGVVDACGSDFTIIGLDQFSYITRYQLKYSLPTENNSDIDYFLYACYPGDIDYKVEGTWGRVEFEEPSTFPYKMHFHIYANDSGQDREFRFVVGIHSMSHYSNIVLTQPSLTAE